MKPDLETIMQNITYDSINNFSETQLQNKIKEQMPGYEIKTWNLDEYDLPSEIFGSIAEEIKYPIDNGKQIEDIQYVEEWCTDSCDAYFCILAIKTK